jgi:outer membrane immunogenic protein
MRRFLGALTALTLFSSFALADGLPYRSKITTEDTGVTEYNWSGLYLGVGAGGQAQVTNLGAQYLGNDIANLNGIGAQDWIANGRLGLDWRMGTSPFVVGVFGEYNWGDSTASLNIANTSVASLSLRTTWAAGGRVGYLFNPTTMGYVGYKYSQADLNLGGAMLTAPCAGSNLNCSQTVNGHSALTGVEWRISSKFSMGLEYSYTRFDSATLYDGGPGSLKITAQPDEHTVMVRLNFRPFGN